MEKNFLLSLLPSSSTQSWVGAHDAVQEGQWLWSDGTAFLYTNWCSGEPNNAQSENCLEINLSKLNQKPNINVPQLTVGKKAEISCKVPEDCLNPSADIVWTGIEPDEIRRGSYGVPGWEKSSSIMTFHPEPEHHNTKLTCTIIFQKSIRTESTVILKVRHAPKILNSSRCLVWGDELTCIHPGGPGPSRAEAQKQVQRSSVAARAPPPPRSKSQKRRDTRNRRPDLREVIDNRRQNKPHR
ncbi:Galactose-specific lectin nattectin [Anabarilius grahami]|uniref:Galactose-specific lectin nattectin n=1 Tax=Anabarilius grahami TaxID=495550 RepID=A0A3N0YG43_ANAGA|nr:Galactose-specific lectin nattectin [Anabarilius grahami]